MDDVGVIGYWVVTSPSEPVSRVAVLGEHDAKVYTDHGWTVEGPFAPADQLAGAFEALDAIARVLDRGTADERKLATITRLVHDARPSTTGGQ